MLKVRESLLLGLYYGLKAGNLGSLLSVRFLELLVLSLEGGRLGCGCL